jgi:hypothetical protein
MSKHAVEGTLDTVRGALRDLIVAIEEEVEECERYGPALEGGDPIMSDDPRGDYLDRDQVLDAIRSMQS